MNVIKRVRISWIWKEKRIWMMNAWDWTREIESIQQIQHRATSSCLKWIFIEIPMRIG